MVFFHADLFAQATTNALSTTSHSSSGLLQMLFGLGLVLAVIFAAAWLLRRLGVPQVGHNPLLKPIGSLTLGARERVVVIEIEGQWLVLGVAPGRVNTLHTLPKGSLGSTINPGSLSNQAQQAFTQKLQQVLRGRKSES